VVDTLAAESSSSSSSSISSGDADSQPMETDEESFQDMPPALVLRVDLSKAWPPLLSPEKLVEHNYDGCHPNCSAGGSSSSSSSSSSISSTDNKEEDKAFLDHLMEAAHASLQQNRHFGDQTLHPSLQQVKWKAILEDSHCNEGEFLWHFRCDLPAFKFLVERNQRPSWSSSKKEHSIC
jgi:hypothetical protein